MKRPNYELFPYRKSVPGGRRGYLGLLSKKGPDEVVLTINPDEALDLAVLLIQMAREHEGDCIQIGLCGTFECDHDGASENEGGDT